MACERMIELLSARLDGALTEEEARTLEAHLAQCPECRVLERQLERLHDGFADLEATAAPEGFAQGVIERLQPRTEDRPKAAQLFRRPQLRVIAGMAACAALCVGLFYGGTGLDRGGANAGAAPAAAPSVQRGVLDGAAEYQGAGAVGGADALPGLQAAGRQVAAILTLDALPENAGLDTQALTDETGRQVWFVSAERLEELMSQAREQNISAVLTGAAEENELCALVLEKARP